MSGDPTEFHETPCVFSCDGDTMLGVCHPVSGAETGVLFVAGGGQYRVGSHRLFVQMARACAAQGVSAFRFDHRGVGDSGGRFGGFENLEADIKAAMGAFGGAAPSLRRLIVLGLCDGASAAVMTAGESDRIDGLVIVNPWVHSSGLEARTRFASYYLGRLKSYEFWMKMLKRQLDIGASSRSLIGYFKEVLRDQLTIGSGAAASPVYVSRMLEGLQRFSGEVLVLLSGQDLVAQQFEQLVTSDRTWKEALDRPGTEIRKLESADHTFSYLEHRRLAERCLTDWLSKWPHADEQIPAAGRFR